MAAVLLYRRARQDLIDIWLQHCSGRSGAGLHRVLDRLELPQRLTENLRMRACA